MNEGTHAVLILEGQEYELSHYKITEDKENYFYHDFECVICDDLKPKVKQDEPYEGRLVVNGDAIWYFPWMWFEKIKLPKIKASTHGSIFCPFGLTKEDEQRYDALNIIVASEISDNITPEVWQNLLLIFSDWLKIKSIPQHQEYIDLASDIDFKDDEDDDDEDEDDDDEDEDEDDFLEESSEEDDEDDEDE